MKISSVKLLQFLAGVLLLSSASLSMAATYDYDFDGDENERGGQPLNVGDLNVYGYKNGREAAAYLDSGSLAGMGVCGELSSQLQTGTSNKCNPSSDDNLQAGEVLEFVCSSTFFYRLQNSFRELLNVARSPSSTQNHCGLFWPSSLVQEQKMHS